MTIHHSISLIWVVSLVNCLAHLHNFCLEQNDQLKVKENLLQRLSCNIQFMMESDDGYVKTKNHPLFSLMILNILIEDYYLSD